RIVIVERDVIAPDFRNFVHHLPLESWFVVIGNDQSDSLLPNLDHLPHVECPEDAFALFHLSRRSWHQHRRGQTKTQKPSDRGVSSVHCVPLRMDVCLPIRCTSQYPTEGKRWQVLMRISGARVHSLISGWVPRRTALPGRPASLFPLGSTPA